MRLYGDINKKIFDKRKEIEGEEINELLAWITDLDQWIAHYERGIEETKGYENTNELRRQKELKAYATQNANATQRAESERLHIESLEILSERMKIWTSKLSRAEKAKKQAKEQLKVMRENFIPNQKMFHRWGYPKTNSQNVQHKHNPFKIN